MTTKIEAIKARLDSVLSVKAEDYKLDDFANNPDGYTVAPYCNEEITSTAFEAGFNSAVAELLPLLEQAVQVAEFYKYDEPFIAPIKEVQLPARQFLASLESWGKK